MAITLSTVESSVRYLINDFSRTQKDFFTYEASSVFTLTEDNPITVSTVLVNDSELSSGDWSYDDDTNKVTITASLSSGDTIEIQYTYYANYSSTEVQSYIRSAINHIGICSSYSWMVSDSTIYPEPTITEQYLIAMIASVLIEPDNKTLRLPDITIVAPSDVPTHDKVRKIIAIFKHNSHGVFFIG